MQKNLLYTLSAPGMTLHPQDSNYSPQGFSLFIMSLFVYIQYTTNVSKPLLKAN